MKKLLIIALATLFVCSMFQTAEAALVEISDPVFAGSLGYFPGYSTDSNSGSYVNLAPSGSLTVGTILPEGGSQAIGMKGVYLSLAPLGTTDGYELYFDQAFSTYDERSYDSFKAFITEGNYFGGPGYALVDGWGWGGTTEGGLEQSLVGYGKQTELYVTPGGNYWLNVGLYTAGDESLPSWGQFSDVHVGPISAIPEPMSLTLFGMGILGLFGLKRKS